MEETSKPKAPKFPKPPAEPKDMSEVPNPSKAPPTIRLLWQSLSIVPDPDGNQVLVADDYNTIERYSGGFLWGHDGFLDWVPDARVLRARVKLA